MALKFRLVTPERSLFDEEAVSVSLPTSEGEVTILPHHAPFTALIVAGLARLTHENGQTEEVAVSDGFVHVTQDGLVTVLTETAERGAELNEAAIEEAKQRAQELMKKAVSTDDVSFAAAAAGVERELARLRLVRKHSSKHKSIGGSTGEKRAEE